MKINYWLIVFLFPLMYSCKEKKTEYKQSKLKIDSTHIGKIIKANENTEFGNLDSIKLEIIKRNITSGDTIKHLFSIEDIGTEGNEGVAYYVDNKLKKVDFDIYTSMWKIHLQFIFINNIILVQEETINTYEKTNQVKKLSYKINLDGEPIGKIDSKRVNVFESIKNIIPFDLK